MPNTPTDIEQLRAQIEGLIQAAIAFVPPTRSDEIMRKWLSGPLPVGLSAIEKTAMSLAAMTYSLDLVLAQPSQSGSTAFDRLARSRGDANGLERQALEALRQARYRVLRIDDAPGRSASARVTDVLSDEKLRVSPGDLPALEPGLLLFAHAVRLGAGVYCLSGSAAPLEEEAIDVALKHPACKAAGAAANARWAETVLGRVVRNCGLPILDAPDEQAAADAEAEDLFGCLGIAGLMANWAACGDAPADAALLRRTRQTADTPSILRTLGGLLGSRADGETALARGCTRAALVMLETIRLRARCGSGGGVTLDTLAASIEDQIVHNGAPSALRGLYTELRGKLGAGGARTIDDPALAAVLQRIQALRAKTRAQGCTEAEALAAAEKAAELLDKYGLSLSEVEFAAQPCDGMSVQTGRKRRHPIDRCVPAIAAFFDCRSWRETARDGTLNYIFFGVRADVLAAHTLYELVERAFETETATFQSGPLYAAMDGERRRATTSFQLGMAYGIHTKLTGLQAARATHQRSASGRDLVQVKASLVDEELDKLGLDLTTGRAGKRRQVLTDAYASGTAAGERFEWAERVPQAA